MMVWLVIAQICLNKGGFQGDLPFPIVPENAIIYEQPEVLVLLKPLSLCLEKLTLICRSVKTLLENHQRRSTVLSEII
jgi:hypothetical protein